MVVVVLFVVMVVVLFVVVVVVVGVVVVSGWGHQLFQQNNYAIIE